MSLQQMFYDAVDMQDAGLISGNVHAGDYVSAEIAKRAQIAIMKENTSPQSYRELDKLAKQDARKAVAESGGSIDTLHNQIVSETGASLKAIGQDGLVSELLEYQNYGFKNVTGQTKNKIMRSSLTPVHRVDSFPFLVDRYCQERNLKPINENCQSNITELFRDDVMGVQRCGQAVTEYTIDVASGKVECKRPGDDPNYLTLDSEGGVTICPCWYHALIEIGQDAVACLGDDDMDRIFRQAARYVYDEAFIGGLYRAIREHAVTHHKQSGIPTEKAICDLIDEQLCDEDCCDYEFLVGGKRTKKIGHLFHTEGGKYSRIADSGIERLNPTGEAGVDKHVGGWFLTSGNLLVGKVMDESFRSGVTVDTERSDRTRYPTRGDIRRCTNTLAFEWGGGFGINPDACMSAIVPDCACPTASKK